MSDRHAPLAGVIADTINKSPRLTGTDQAAIRAVLDDRANLLEACARCIKLLDAGYPAKARDVLEDAIDTAKGGPP